MMKKPSFEDTRKNTIFWDFDARVVWAGITLAAGMSSGADSYFYRAVLTQNFGCQPPGNGGSTHGAKSQEGS